MKKLLYLLIPIMIAACNGGDKQPGTVLVTPAVDTTKVIEGTFVEDGDAPVATVSGAKVSKAEKQKKEKVACAFNFQKFNNKKRPKEEAPGGGKGKPQKPPKPGSDTEAPRLNGDPVVSVIMSNRMNIDWPAASDNRPGVVYDLYRNGTKINTSDITTLGWVDIGLTPNTTYAYHYRARDAAGNISGNSGTVSGTTTSGGGTDPPPPTNSNNVIYLNFFGKDVTATMWNSGTFTVGESGLADVEISYVLTLVQQHFNPYNVTVTTDRSIFDAAALGHKVEIIITETYQWFGQAGGVAYINSFFWTDGTPGFVFSLLLNYNSHWIASAVTHEAGHTLGLRHQCDCDANGNVINQYSTGPVMGVGYYETDGGKWITGTSSLSCAIQDDNAKLTAALGVRQFARNIMGVYYDKPMWTAGFFIKPKEHLQ